MTKMRWTSKAATAGLLAVLNDEITTLAGAVVPSTAIVTGQTKDFGAASGSAWLCDDRHLVTNHHVVEGLVAPIWVRFPACSETEAELVGSDPLTDLAVLRVSPHTALPLQLRQHPPRLGELCFAFGSPLGEFPESVAFGIVSGLKRSLPSPGGRAIYDVIQTDCAINPGNSGGPLVGIDQRVLGVNTAVISGAEGIGFAVPADVVADIIAELITHGSIERASLGVSVATRPVGGGDRLVITSVRASAAGPFQQGDVLLQVGQHKIASREDLLRVLRRDMVEQPVQVEVLREEQGVSFECRPSRLR
jgi:S1-C subfamily serine protease